MLAIELISPIIPIVNELDTPARALRLMSEFHLSQLPFVEDDQYICLLEENGLLDQDDPEMLLKNVNLPYLKPAVKGSSHFFEALKIAGDFKLSLVPVVDDESHYL
ncbi:MAG: CBS domain-containing protein, partial [Chitinophagaceae bacterium]